MRKFWDYGTSEPFQRIGLIVLIIGIVSLLSWLIRNDISIEDLLEPYYLPRSRDSIFFHLFFYFIPIGLLMTWGYKLLTILKSWIFKEKFNKENLKNRTLHFKNTESAFEFASNIYPPEMDLNKAYFGIVKDIILNNQGELQYTLELPNTSSPIRVYGFSENINKGLKLGTLVLWFCETPISNRNQNNIEALGKILAILSPEYDPNTGQWKILEHL